jgi:integrase
LNLDDFHPAEQRLFVAAGKFRKARWIPLAPSVAQALERYVEQRLAVAPPGPQAPLFINLRSHRLHHCGVNHDFHRLLGQCGIARGEHSAPRLHDLRHYADSRIMPNRQRLPPLSLVYTPTYGRYLVFRRGIIRLSLQSGNWVRKEKRHAGEIL